MTTADFACDCVASGNVAKPKQHGADPHAKNCAYYRRPTREETHAIARAPLPAVTLVGRSYAWGGHAVYRDPLTRPRMGDWDTDPFNNFEEE